MSENRVDSVHVLTEIYKKADKEILPLATAPLEEKEMPFWRSIVSARHKWTDIDLIHAANLARTLCAIEEETQALKKEGSVVLNQRGTTIMNPRHTVLEQLSRRAAAISVKLQIHAQATMGEPRDQKKKNETAKKASESMNNPDQLLAKPD